MPFEPLAPGWYDDPFGTGVLRWFDGGKWTQDVRPPGLKPQLSPEPDHESDQESELEPRRRRWLRGWEWSVVVAAVLLVAAGGAYFGAGHGRAAPKKSASNSLSESPNSRGSAGSPLEAQGTGYLATGSTFVDFIQWSDDGGTLSGGAEEVFAQGTVPQIKAVTDTFVVSGSLAGDVLSLSFDRGPQVFASISSSSFTVNYPQPDGTMALVTFEPSNSNQYNAAVDALNQRIAQENQGTLTAQALQQAVTAINDQVARVQSDLSLLAQDESATNGVVGVVPATLQAQSAEVRKTQQAEQQVAAERGSSNQTKTCHDAETVATDASSVAGDAAEVGGQAATVEASLSSTTGLRGAVAQLSTDFSQLQRDEAVLPTYSPPNAPTQSDVSGAESNATSLEQSSVSDTNGDIDQANASVSTAYQYVTEAYQAARTCGAAPAAPAPVQHIS